MKTTKDKIYDYFERDSELKVLFIFNNPFLEQELKECDWEAGYRYVKFGGDWFTTKYKLDNDWANDKVVMYFEQDSPLNNKQLQQRFPLMDVLTANIEYNPESYLAFMQQFRLPQNMATFVERNLALLQTDRVMRLLAPYYSEGSVTPDIGVRAILSFYLQCAKVLEWDEIMLNIIFLGCKSEEQKRNDFFKKLFKSPMVKEYLDKHVSDIFRTGIEYNSDVKVGRIVQTLKYNAIIQNLAIVQYDNYKNLKIADAIALQQLNRILESALNKPETEESLIQVIDELGSEVRDSDIIFWYGINADYYFYPEGLCIPILKKLMSETILNDPENAIKRIESLITSHVGSKEIGTVMDYCVIVARYYERTMQMANVAPPQSAEEYITEYQRSYCLGDQLYRQAIESFYNCSNVSEKLSDDLLSVKRRLDEDYAKWCNRLNLEWTKIVKNGGGLSNIKTLRQRDFYDKLIKPMHKKVAVIVSDALRYEVAQELIGKLSKRKHTAKLGAMFASLPTETKYCKPSLLPHETLSLIDNCKGGVDMTVDGKVLDSTQKRSDHLMKYNSDSLCVEYEDVAKYDRERNREIFKHSLVYVMHDMIDRNSHDAPAKNIVANCSEAIKEIDELVHKIHETYNVTEIFITSDHGFLFNDQEFADKDKHKIEEDTKERSSRYYLAESSADVAGLSKYCLEEVSGMSADGIYVAVPDGTNRFAAPSGGYMFTHGGATLQEMIVPVIESRQERENNRQPVGVTLLTRNLIIQASRLRFILLQTEALGEETKERTITVALYSNDSAVTPVKRIVLDKTEQSLDNRKIVVDLTLNQNVEAKVTQLKVYDIDDDINPLIKENVTNKTLIENDFDI